MIGNILGSAAILAIGIAAQTAGTGGSMQQKGKAQRTPVAAPTAVPTDTAKSISSKGVAASHCNNCGKTRPK